MNDKNGIDKKLLDILVCPISKGPLKYNKGENELISLEAGLAFPVEDGIPIMLLGRARKINN
ncbi:Trm112 family protein [Alphaproteobacteria bacterium]|nr:Trm112 family protein [Alphaproteobacteria bacterium]